MNNLKFTIDVEGISNSLEGLKKDIQKDIVDSADKLAKMTHAKVLELADEKLKSLAGQYKDNVVYDDTTPFIWIVTLKDPAEWIEEGRKSGFMEELLHGKSSHQGKNGRYAVIPFKHNVLPSRQSPKAADLARIIKTEAERRGISWGNIEKMPENAKEKNGFTTAKLHSFSFDNPRAEAQLERHKHPLTHGVSIYQTKNNKTGEIRKDVMTFRVISEKDKNTGAWRHPGRPGAKLLEKAFEFAKQVWDKDILPSIFGKYGKKK